MRINNFLNFKQPYWLMFVLEMEKEERVKALHSREGGC